MIYVIATLQLHPGAQERVLSEVEAVSAKVRKEDGCLEYRAAVDIESGLARQIPLRPDVIVIVERWLDLEALQAHSVAPHVQTFRQRVADAVVSTSVQVLSPA